MALTIGDANVTRKRNNHANIVQKPKSFKQPLMY